MTINPARKLTARLARGIDQLFIRSTFRGDGSRARTTPSPEYFAQMAEFYQQAAISGRLFPEPASVTFRMDPVRDAPAAGYQVVDLQWTSRWEPLRPGYQKALERCPQTRIAHARWFRHRQPAPTLICLHGWGAGHFAIEERAFPVKWLVETLGLDVVLMTLPFHAARRGRRSSTPAFPSGRPVRANEGFAQAILDLRTLMATLLDEFGAPSVSVSGMSLGGFTTALLATVEPRLELAIPIIPFASLPRLLWEHGEGSTARRRAEEAGVNLDDYAAAFAPTTPTRRKPVIPGRNVMVIVGEEDRVTPARHGRELHRHFKGAQLETWYGAHILQLGRANSFRAMGRFLGQHLDLSRKT